MSERKPQRYHCGDGGMEDAEDGDFVHHADYAALEAEVERLTEIVSDAEIRLDDRQKRIASQERKAAGAQSEIERLKATLKQAHDGCQQMQATITYLRGQMMMASRLLLAIGNLKGPCPECGYAMHVGDGHLSDCEFGQSYRALTYRATRKS